MQAALRRLLVLGAVTTAQFCLGQELHLQLDFPGKIKSPTPPAVAWLKPLQSTVPVPGTQRKTYTLLQKNRRFVPHLLVVPVGSEVMFPNEDPFYHNVFSLFDGKRFDLGLYEAGSAKTVLFSREGVSYIFCNIHPEMSAVVVALSTPYFGTADAAGLTTFHNVPPGDYELHVWAEGVPQPVLDRLTHHIHITAEQSELGQVKMPVLPAREATHLNKFGQPYDRNSQTPY